MNLSYPKPFEVISMAAEYGVGDLSSKDHPYFFISYARSPLLSHYPGADPDRWVRRFFRDLVVAVRQHASRPSAQIHGFIDQQIPPGSDRESLLLALGTAQVLVPLYSIGYLATP